MLWEADLGTTDGRTDGGTLPEPRTMAERKQSGKAAEDEEVPAFFKNLGSGSPKPRQKFCGMFCPVEGSSENKTIDFDSLSVGRGSGQVVAQQRDVAHLGPDPQPPYSRQGRRAGGEPSVESGRKVAIRRASGKEALQNVYDQVGMGEGRPEKEDGARGSPLPRLPECPPSCPSPDLCEHPTLLYPSRRVRRGSGWAVGHAPTKAAGAYLGLGGGGGKDGPIPGWGIAGWGAGMGGGSILLTPSRRLLAAAVAWCPTLFRCSSERAVGASGKGPRAPRGSGAAGAGGAQTAAPPAPSALSTAPSRARVRSWRPGPWSAAPAPPRRISSP